MAQALVDTSAAYALLDRSDANHVQAKRRLSALRESRVSPVLTNFIVAETHALLLSRLDAAIARRWLTTQVWPIERVTAEDELRARTIIVTQADKTYSYTDAVSFAVMERRGVKTAFAFDPHFRQYGWLVIGLR